MNKDILTEYMKHLMEYSRKLSRPKIIKSRLPTNLRPHLILDADKMMHVAKNIQNVPESHCHQVGPRSLARLQRIHYILCVIQIV